MNNIINIFDGSIETVKSKCTLPFEVNGVFSEDLYSSKNVQIYVFEKEIKINLYDAFYMKIYNRVFIGRIEKIKRDTKTLLTLKFGINIFSSFVNMPKNVLNGYSITETLASPIKLIANSNDDIITTDTDLELDTLLRQSCRKSPKKISMEYVENADLKQEQLLINVSDFVEKIYSIKLSEFLDVKESYANDSFTMVILKNQDDPNDFKKYYKYVDGTIGEDINKAVKPIITSKVRKVQSDNLTLDYAKSIFKDQNYNNEIVIKVPVINNCQAFEFNDTFLSRKLIVYSDNMKEPIDTIISKYEIIGEINTITLGLSRTNLTDKLNKQKEMIR